ncbi:hypothetical protein HC000_02030 [Pseudoalteromonas sp. MIP2626]|uniref:hypothetical protein n=1 Tax=Pseudoalteromonas sp. MIP2626 TaxID=2705464 RepID=UPI0015CEC6AC|nr:hypothetical protein [Pseudoalteromonas sp. MIP2626]NYR11278.1 hypothetical protein [Pseudoalteromonas sp. MIP2626]
MDDSTANKVALEVIQQYKELSFNVCENNFITPNENIQMREVSLHPSVGRDRVFDFPKDLRADIEFEHLAHLHFVESHLAESGKPQWYCTSPYAAVYSGFFVAPKHVHIYVHDLLTPANGIEDAHEFYTRDLMESYLYYASEIRRNHK